MPRFDSTIARKSKPQAAASTELVRTTSSLFLVRTLSAEIGHPQVVTVKRVVESVVRKPVKLGGCVESDKKVLEKIVRSCFIREGILLAPQFITDSINIQ
jgi:hypothetical protein